jgi:mRNA interferase MazF
VIDPTIRRGEIWWVSFDPAIGGEIRKTRPAVVVSNDRFNLTNNRVQVVPLTSSEKRLYLFEAYVMVRGRQNKAMADQIKTIAKERMREKIGHVTIEEMKAIEKAIRIQLAL